MDLIITYFQKKYLIELKVWRGEKAHRKGIEQLAEQHSERGYLVIFDHRKEKEWEKKRICKAGKKIFAIWVRVAGQLFIRHYVDLMIEIKWMDFWPD